MPLCDLIQKMEDGVLPVVIRDGYIWGCEMDRSVLDEAYSEARSFQGLSPPQGAQYIGCQRRPSGLYLYWKDREGKYWYETDRGMEFKRQMEEAQKKEKRHPGATGCRAKALRKYYKNNIPLREGKGKENKGF